MRDRLDINDKHVEEIKGEVKAIKEDMSRDVLLTAEMREDIDGLENENLKSMVVVRKLKADSTVPKDKKALRTYIQDLSRNLVRKVLDDESAKKVKYATTLYSYIDPTKKDNKDGLVPPFKICFNDKTTAIRFRETAVKLARGSRPRTRIFDSNSSFVMDDNETAETENTSEFKNTYFTYFQTAATRIRVMLMWAVADALKTKDKQVWVNQNNKPTLQVKEGGKVVKTMSFVKTMVEYKEKISAKSLSDVLKTASKQFVGQLEKTFIVLKD